VCTLAVIGVALFASAAQAAPAAGAHGRKALPVPSLDWFDCGGGWQCATALVPRDYARPSGMQLEVAVTRLPAKDQSNRIGSLFVNFGGPGGDAVASLQDFGADLFASLNDRFDIVGFDPRGTGQTESAIDCRVDQERLGLYAQPFTTPENLDVKAWRARAERYVDLCVRRNRSILPYVSTASVARDMDLLREAVGDRKLTYLGYSYGTFLGATYARLFPDNYRALVLDGAIDADEYINRPTQNLQGQSAALERELGRFFQACAADQEACLGFGGDDPHAAFDDLVAEATANPIPAGGDDPREVNDEDVLAGTLLALYAKQLWPILAEALAEAQAGDATLLRALTDIFYGWLPDGTYDPLSDRYFVLSAAEQRYPSNLRHFLDAGLQSWGLFHHFWVNTGYSELPLGLFPVQARGAYYGPFRVPRSSPTILVVGTTYDPATPYRGARRLVSELGRARLLTMQGDGHTAYGGNSSCIDETVDEYLTDLTLPAPHTVCPQEVPFEQPPLEPDSARRVSPLSALRADPRVVRALR
jgi:pimeloyl-ACP methyl ester carboxylesterase